MMMMMIHFLSWKKVIKGTFNVLWGAYSDIFSDVVMIHRTENVHNKHVIHE